jgi:membrane protein
MADLGQATDPPESATDAQRPSSGSRLLALRDRCAAVVARVEGGVPGTFWSRLNAVDFLNSSFAFSALAVLCGFPFLAVVHAAVGTDVRQAIITRMGLNAEAARDVNALIAPGHHAVATLTVASGVLLVVGAVGMASTLQAWYHRIYERTPPQGALKHIGYQLAGAVAFTVYIGVEIVVLHAVERAGLGHVVVFGLEFVFAVLFWWTSAYFLLFRKVPWRQLLPAGIATGVCITGLGVFSALLFSGQITSGEKSYGPAGVVLAIASYLVGFGVCLHLGAVFGRMWNDWRAATSNEEPR